MWNIFKKKEKIRKSIHINSSRVYILKIEEGRYHVCYYEPDFDLIVVIKKFHDSDDEFAHNEAIEFMDKLTERSF